MHIPVQDIGPEKIVHVSCLWKNIECKLLEGLSKLDSQSTDHIKAQLNV